MSSHPLGNLGPGSWQQWQGWVRSAPPYLPPSIANTGNLEPGHNLATGRVGGRGSGENTAQNATLLNVKPPPSQVH